jgi:hypothetical protein
MDLIVAPFAANITDSETGWDHDGRYDEDRSMVEEGVAGPRKPKQAASGRR